MAELQFKLVELIPTLVHPIPAQRLYWAEIQNRIPRLAQKICEIQSRMPLLMSKTRNLQRAVAQIQLLMCNRRAEQVSSLISLSILFSGVEIISELPCGSSVSNTDVRKEPSVKFRNASDAKRLKLIITLSDWASHHKVQFTTRTSKTMTEKI